MKQENLKFEASLGYIGILCLKNKTQLGMVLHACNISTRGIGAGQPGIHGRPHLPIEFEASLGYVSSCL